MKPRIDPAPMTFSRRRVLSGIMLAGMLLLSSTVLHAAETVIRIGDFSRLSSDSPLPVEWQPLTFKKIEQHTRYRVVTESGHTVIQADSRHSASGLIRKVSIDPREFPWLSWRWKVSSVYAKGDVASKRGDDFPARVYIAFAYDPAQAGLFEKAQYEAARLIYGETPPLAAITYIWANQAPTGLMVANAYTERVKMVVLQSGATRAGRWMSEKRNIYADYKAAFGREPTRISGVAIMTDSDNTGESASAWYGDIIFSTE